MSADQNLLRDVTEILAQVLGVDESEIGLHSLFESELGGESIDVIDLRFQLEKRFAIKLSFNDLERAFSETGGFRAVADSVRDRYPLLARHLEQLPPQSSWLDIFTPEVLVEMVQQAMLEPSRNA